MLILREKPLHFLIAFKITPLPDSPPALDQEIGLDSAILQPVKQGSVRGVSVPTRSPCFLVVAFKGVISLIDSIY